VDVLAVTRITVPLDVAAAVLVVLGILLIVLEVHLPGAHVPGAAGAVSLGLGIFFAVRSASPSARTSEALLIAAIGCVLVVAAFVARAVVIARRQPPSPHPTSKLIGAEGLVQRALDPTGIVRAEGEAWTARAKRAPVPEGARVRIVAVDGLTLEVEPIHSEVGGQ
jgi:membrane-bound serine protease (ClpP class)